MMDLPANTFPILCQKVVQNSIEFYIGKVKMKYLSEMITVTQRTIFSFDDNGLPLYNGQIQRKPNSSRVHSIKEYLISDDNASFPNNILISIPAILLIDEPAEYDRSNDLFWLNIDKSKINLTSNESPLYLQVFDGQHRFRGLQEAIKELSKENNDVGKLEQLLNFEFTISFFIDAPIEIQAMLFSIINRTPVKVSQDLVYDLFNLTNKDSPQKTALAIVLELNGLKEKIIEKPNEPVKKHKSPFYKRIRLLGKKEVGYDSPISQGMFIKTIIKLISPTLRDAEGERLIGRDVSMTKNTEKTIFRNWFISNKDNNIFTTLLNYFIAVRETFVDENGNSYWDFDLTPDNALQRTIGFSALIEILIKIFPFCMRDKNISVDYFKTFLEKAKGIKLIGDERPYPYTSKGASMLREDLENTIFNN